MPNCFFAFGKPAWQHEDHPPPSRPWSSPVIICPSPSYRLCSERHPVACGPLVFLKPVTSPTPDHPSHLHIQTHTHTQPHSFDTLLCLFSFYSFHLNFVFVYSCYITLLFCVCLKMFLFFLRLLKYMWENNFCQVSRKVNSVAPRQNRFVRL